jgi:ubiquinone/menaquinone biosynthesis C-methylase UbiE
MLQNLDTANYFDRHAIRYDELVETVAFQLDDAYNYLAEYVTAMFPGKSQLRVLELGIGTGRFTRHLLEVNHAALVTGIDASSQMLERAALNLAQYQDRLTFIPGEFPEAIPDLQYDCVVSAIALSFYPIDYDVLFRELHRRLAPGGIVAYAVNVAYNNSCIDTALSRMLGRKMELTAEQLQWMKGIQGNVQLYQVPVDWHRAQLQRGGFCDVDCIYLRHKLGVFSGAKARVAV